MKNVLLIINIILICLVAYLYYLHFHSVAKIETHAAQNNLQGKQQRQHEQNKGKLPRVMVEGPGMRPDQKIQR